LNRGCRGNDEDTGTGKKISNIHGQSGAIVSERFADQDIGANKRRFMAGGAPWLIGKYESPLVNETHSGPTLEALVQPQGGTEPAVRGA
jgi:hypothetical protein